MKKKKITQEAYNKIGMKILNDPKLEVHEKIIEIFNKLAMYEIVDMDDCSDLETNDI